MSDMVHLAVEFCRVIYISHGEKFLHKEPRATHRLLAYLDQEVF